MHRFFLPADAIEGGAATLKGREWRHGRTVLRVGQKDRLTLFDGAGTEYLAEIVELQPHAARVRILQKTVTPRPPYDITLAQALPKSKAMDYIVQKATELGVRQIMPVFSERSVVRLEPAAAASRVRRWREIAMDAAKQCGLNWLPEITLPKTMTEVAGLHATCPLAFIGSLQPEARPLWSHLRDHATAGAKCLLMIGPEGDFTPAEMATARSAGFLPLSLGPLVLRCDTAAVCAISTLSYELRRRE